MKDYGFGDEHNMDYEGFYGEEMGNDGSYQDGYYGSHKEKHPMLEHVISLLKALIGILDIISDNFDKRK